MTEDIVKQRLLAPTAASFALALLVAAGCTSGAESQEGRMNTLTAEEQAAGWRLLFDGRTTDGWRGYNAEVMPDGWQVVDGTLTRVAAATDIITTEQFTDFELALDWKVGPGGNSGVLYRVIEGPDQTYHSGPEMQVLDDAGHQDGGSPLTSAGANYGLDPAPRGVVKSAGEWNSARILVDGNHVEHWLNGEKVVEYELGSAEWKEKVANSKFN
ncbi:MAG: 3-keto-disaccharide hydrolase, partial [Longimicrobiales bacterium]